MPNVAPATDNNNNNNNNNKPAKQRIYNPHWKGYSFLFISSLINLSAISNVPKDDSSYQGVWGMALSFSAVTLTLSLVVLVLDRTQLLVDKFHYTTFLDGRFEGYVLLIVTVWWIVGVAYMTQVQGIAYTVLNIYLSAWLSFASTLYTLNSWSTKQDILSWQELTGVSATLKSWYILWLASSVVLGTCCNYLYYFLQGEEADYYNNHDTSDLQGAAIVGVVLGFASWILSFGFILIHYRFVQCCNTGGWIEVLIALGITVLWIAGCAVLTQEGAIGATITGKGCLSSTTMPTQEELSAQYELLYSEATCLVSVLSNDTAANSSNVVWNVTLPCHKIVTPTTEPFIPGSNLYVAVWTCLGASIHLILRWKAQRALQFAQAQERTRHDEDFDSTAGDDVRKSSDDDDEDLDEFVDAVN